MDIELGSFSGVWSWRCGCIVTWFCYQMIAKPGTKTATPPWPDPHKIWLPIVLLKSPKLTWRCWSHVLGQCVLVQDWYLHFQCTGDMLYSAINLFSLPFRLTICLQVPRLPVGSLSPWHYPRPHTASVSQSWAPQDRHSHSTYQVKRPVATYSWVLL